MRRRPTLPHGFPCSTIGSGGLNCRVRDGNGCDPTDIATANLERARRQRPSADRYEGGKQRSSAVLEVPPRRASTLASTHGPPWRPEKRETKPHARLVPVS